jgi:hypothetical protein
MEELLKFQRREEERTGNFSNPWKYTKEKQHGQMNCNCRHDPAKHKGTCGVCGGWVE